MSIKHYEHNNPKLSAPEIQELVGVFELLLKWDQALPVLVDSMETNDGSGEPFEQESRS